MKNAVQTTHNLDFESRPWSRDNSINEFRIGTYTGQWSSTDFAFQIISIVNNDPGNGHLEDVFEWFEYACKRDGRMLMICEFMNDRFKKHCIEKRGFQELPGRNDLIKIFQI